MVENNLNINKINVQKRVLVAPLDWGLGHATRCIPIVRELLVQGFEVLIGAEKAGAILLQKEFPSIKVISLHGYNISYSEKKRFFLWKMVAQLPKILRIINIFNY